MGNGEDELFWYDSWGGYNALDKFPSLLHSMGHLESKWNSKVKDYVIFEQGILKWHWKSLDEEEVRTNF